MDNPTAELDILLNLFEETGEIPIAVYSIITNTSIIWDFESLSKLLKFNFPLTVFDKGSRIDQEFSLPKILGLIKISNEALIKLKNYWYTPYNYTSYKYKRGDSFTYYEANFPLYKRLFQNPNLDKDFLIQNILPEKADLKMLKSIDSATDYLFYI